MNKIFTLSFAIIAALSCETAHAANACTKKYEDKNFGFSFNYPCSWKISEKDDKELAAAYQEEGSKLHKELIIDNIVPDEEGDVISVTTTTGPKFTDNDAHNGPMELHYSGSRQRWEGSFPFYHAADGKNPKAPEQAKLFAKTTSGLPIFQTPTRWMTFVIPLSHTKFIRMNITGDGETEPLEHLVKTFSKIQ